MKLPNLFIVGTPSCGTSAPSEYVAYHPNVFVSDLKELNFLNGDLFQKDAIGVHTFFSLDEYLEHLAGANENHLAVGEGSPQYLHSKVAMQNMLDFNPEARLIVMVGNPVVRTQVHWELSLGLGLRRTGWKPIYDPSVVNHYRALTFYEEQWHRFSATALTNTVQNETLVLLEYLSPLRRFMFDIWATLVGTRGVPGFTQWLRFCPREGGLAGAKLRASLRGKGADGEHGDATHKG
jgi:hypothetical protein